MPTNTSAVEEGEGTLNRGEVLFATIQMQWPATFQELLFDERLEKQKLNSE